VLIAIIANLVVPFPRSQITAMVLLSLLLLGAGSIYCLLIWAERKTKKARIVARAIFIGTIVFNFLPFLFSYLSEFFWISNMIIVNWMFFVGAILFFIRNIRTKSESE
jgi:hypothetical protein